MSRPSPSSNASAPGRRRFWSRAVFSMLPLALVMGATELVFRAAMRPASLVGNLQRTAASAFENGAASPRASYFWLGSSRERYVRSRSVTPPPELVDAPGDPMRIAVIGGSSAAGYPYDARLAFPNILRAMLETLYPDTEFQVINLAYFAQTYAFGARAFRDVAPLAPKFLLVYSGHNEHYPYNLAQLIERRRRSGWQRSLDRLASSLGSNSRAFGWALDQRAPPEFTLPPEFDAAGHIDDAVDNFASITRELTSSARASGTHVLVSTLARNLADFPPDPYSESLDTSYPAMAPDQFAVLAPEQKADPRFLYRVARWHHAEGAIEAARARYVEASDRVFRLARAHSKIQSWIRSAGDRDENLLVVDSERFVESATATPILGDDALFDWVHPRLATNYLIASAHLDVMSPLLHAELGDAVGTVPTLIEIEPRLSEDISTSKANGLIEAGYINVRVGRPDVAFGLLRLGLESGPSQTYEIKGALSFAVLSAQRDDLSLARALTDMLQEEVPRDLIENGLNDFRDLDGVDVVRSLLE